MLAHRAKTDLGQWDDLRQYETTGAALVMQAFDRTGAYYDLAKGGAKTDLGDLGKVREIRFSADSTVLVIQAEDGASMYFDLAAGGKKTMLGVLVGLTNSVLSTNGAALVARSEDRTAVLYDLAAPSPALAKDGETPLKGAALAASVFAASGDAIRLFPARLRGARAEDAETRAERGRHAASSIA